jgi:curved DNA-binding protein CbpA
MIEAERYYRILELEPGASPEEVHQGYLDLTWVWHPDRFTGHPRLQKKAQYKLQELNEAHEQLRSFRPTRKTQELRAKSKSQAYPPPQDPSSAESWYKPPVNRTRGRDDKKTINDCMRHVSFNTRDVGEWLD